MSLKSPNAFTYGSLFDRIAHRMHESKRQSGRRSGTTIWSLGQRVVFDTCS